MKTKTLLIMALIVGCVIMGIMAVKHREISPELAKKQVRQNEPVAPTRVAPAQPQKQINVALDNPQPPPVKPEPQQNPPSKPPPAISQPDQQMDFTDPAVKEQWGRLALSFVGADPYAEEIWIETINDPDLSADARQNLIEDLNEDGLSDPRNPSVYDLPLIENRIMLIEQLAPYAMDDVNAAAFLEAYKDLVNMWLRLRG